MSENIPQLPDPPEPSVAISGKYKDDCRCEHCKNRRSHKFWNSRRGRILKAFRWLLSSPTVTYIIGFFVGLIVGILL